MQFIGDFSIQAHICDRLIELHRACDRQGLAKAGRLYLGGKDDTSVDVSKKESFDVRVGDIPEALQNEFGVPLYIQALQRCTQEYLARFPHLEKLAFKVTESPLIQHYRPGGGFKSEHFERMNASTATRVLVWMTFLNDVADAGGTRFVYQNVTFEARRGRTLIWPPDFTPRTSAWFRLRSTSTSSPAGSTSPPSGGKIRTPGRCGARAARTDRAGGRPRGGSPRC